MIALLTGLTTNLPNALQQRLMERDVTVLNINTRKSWDTARDAGAFHLDSLAFSETELPSDRRAALVFYRSNPKCRKAPNAARRARGRGYANVRVLSAGITGWIAAKLPTEGSR